MRLPLHVPAVGVRVPYAMCAANRRLKMMTNMHDHEPSACDHHLVHSGPHDGGAIPCDAAQTGAPQQEVAL